MSSTNSSNYHLPEIIKVDSEKCVNCHACIGVYPAKYCNNASEPSKGILINSDLCIVVVNVLRPVPMMQD